jgi:hypothetical protein
MPGQLCKAGNINLCIIIIIQLSNWQTAAIMDIWRRMILRDVGLHVLVVDLEYPNNSRRNSLFVDALLTKINFGLMAAILNFGHHVEVGNTL